MKAWVHIASCTQMFTAALFIITQNWQHPRRPSTGDWLNEPWSRETLFGNEKEWIADTATTRKTLQRIMLSKKADLQRLHTVWFHYVTLWKCWNDRNKLISGCQGLKKGEREESKSGYKRAMGWQDPCGDKTVCSASNGSTVDVLVVMVYDRCSHWRKQCPRFGWWCTIDLWVVPTGEKWVTNT